MNVDYILRSRNQPALLRQADRNLGSSAPEDLTSSAASSAAPSVHSESKTNSISPFTRKGTRGPEVVNGDLAFEDALDVLNPLQHIPIVNTLYREMTGDKISGMAQIAGSALYGGPLGIVSGVASAIVEQETGKDIGGNMMAMLTGDKKPKLPDAAPAPAETMVAEAQEAKEAAPEQAIAEAEIPEQQPETAVVENPKSSGQPFGGVMAPPTSLAAAETGQKFYSLAKVPRTANSNGEYMPIKNSPDVRLKPINQQAIGVARAPVAAGEVPLTAKDEAIKILGLGNEGDALAHAAVPSGSQPLPPQLIQDMMMNLQKYQDGVKNGTLRGGMVDVDG